MDTVGNLNPNMRPKRWKRPRLYLTVVSLFLLISTSMIIMISAYNNYRYNQSVVEANAGASFGNFIFFFIWIGVGIVSLVSLLGAIELLRGSKKGIYVSLAGLILMNVTFPILIGLYFTPIPESPERNSIFFFSFFSSIAAAVAMYPFLILGWKRVNWK